MIRACILIVALLFAGSCGKSGREASAAVAAVAQPGLRGASIGPGGFATITAVPPAPSIPAEPHAPTPLTAKQRAEHEQFARIGRFQNEVRKEVEALTATLRARERGNFVDLYYENEGEPSVVFRFKRNPKQTLAKYTRNPRFFAETVRYGKEELRAAMDFMLRTFREDRIILGGGTGSKSNRAEIEIAITEPEFRALVARKRVTIPKSVKLTFAATQSAFALNRPLPPQIASLVRIFPRDDRPVGALNAIDSRAKVVLRDGCFRVEGGEHDRAFVLFPIGAQLFIDSEGYLAFGSSAAPGYARVGETIVTPGTIAEVTAPELVEPIHRACGAGKVVKINGMQSDSADRAQQAVQANAEALRQFRQSYGLSETVARKALERCKAQSGFGACLITPPPPPPPDGPACPAGTKPSFGLCRTPEGYIRPIPKWIQDLMSEE